MKQLKLVAVAVFALLALVAVLQNMGQVSVSFLFWGPFTLPIALVLFVTALAGFLLGVAAAYLVLRRSRATPPGS